MYNTFYRKKEPFHKRYIALITVVAIILGCFCLRLSDWQLVNASKYSASASGAYSRIVTVSAPRGEIVDLYGRSLVYNRDGFNIVFDATALSSDTVNVKIKTLIALMRKFDSEWFDNTPLGKAAPYGFSAEAKSADITAMRNRLGLARYATAENCFDAMVARYALEGYSKEEQRLIMGVRYTMELADYSAINPYTFAEDVAREVADIIEQYSADLEGVTVAQSTFREYADSALAPHILGYIGLMDSEEWQAVKDTGEYKFNDKIGKAGIEKAAQEYLRGTDGKYRINYNADGSIASVDTLQETVPGRTVQLTLNADLQRVAQDALRKTIADINAKPTKNGPATAGAVVITNVRDGGVLASATYPTYDMAEYLENPSLISEQSGNPLFNRALNGMYQPGSTFKPAIALIGIHLGKITPDETIRCTHTYTRFADFQPSCLGWHGSLNVTKALAKSCNYFFYELGYRIGIEDMNYYCKQLGLGVQTGVELSETKGILAGKEYRESINQPWYQGDTVQAAIGHSDNAFSPLQLAAYTSTIANGGTRYRAHFINSVYDYTLSNVINGNFTEILNTTEIVGENFDIVKQGMLAVTEDGTAAATFSNYPIKVGGKTGSATANGKTNAVFIAFAPYNDPEISISIIIENGGHGSSIAPMAKKIFDEYFFNSAEQYLEQETGVLLP